MARTAWMRDTVAAGIPRDAAGPTVHNTRNFVCTAGVLLGILPSC